MAERTKFINTEAHSFLVRFQKRWAEQNLSKYTAESQRWFMDKVREFDPEAIRKDMIAGADKKEAVTTPIIGRMYTYQYRAKWDAKLPYWDKFPLIFLLDIYPDGWLGINLHYLYPKVRLALMIRLLDIANNDRFDYTTKLRMNYQTLKASGKFPEVKPTLHRYLTTQVRSKMLFISAKYWETALFLPTQSWVRATDRQVWEQSRHNYWK